MFSHVANARITKWRSPWINAFQPKRVPDEFLVELVGLLLSATAASAIMGLTFILLSAVVWAEIPHPLIGALCVTGAIASVARTAFLLIFNKKNRGRILTVGEAGRWERTYAGLCFAFASILGAFCAATLILGPPVTHLLATALLFGYCSGVVARISVRSRIALPCLALAAIPMIIAALLRMEFEYNVFAAFLLVFLFGGSESALFVARSVRSQLEMRRELASLARNDHLTGLGNRLALRSRFDGLAYSDAVHGIAIHCLDLDRFKQVNDRYGHPVGDALLTSVAERIRRLVGPGDLAVRIGGDEFVVLQSNVDHADQAEIFARRMRREISLPYAIEGKPIVIGASLGYALSPKDGTSLEELIACADAALYNIKRLGGGSTGCAHSPDDRLVRAVS